MAASRSACPSCCAIRTSCATQLVINEAYVNSLKKGGTLKLTAKNRQNKDLVIDINLAGFTVGL